MNILLLSSRVDPDTSAFEEPKFIVFYRMLLQLFTLFCFKCKENGPSATMQQNGTMVTVTQNCSTLPEGNVWKPCEIVCEKKTYFTHFSYDFHTFSHVFHIIFSHACEIILCERHVKDIWKSMWNRVILFTYFFTYNFTHFNARFIGRNFTYFSHASSHKSSYAIEWLI